MTLDQKTIRRAIETRSPNGATTLAKTLEGRGQIQEILSLREIDAQVIPALVGELFEREGLGGLKRVIEFGANAASRREATQRFVSEVRKANLVKENGFALAGIHYLNHERNPKTGRMDLSRIRDPQIDGLIGRILCENGLARRLVEEYHAIELEKTPVRELAAKERELEGKYLEKYLPN